MSPFVVRGFYPRQQMVNNHFVNDSRLGGHMHGIVLLDDSNMVNNHFINDSFILVREEKDFVDGSLACLDTLFH